MRFLALILFLASILPAAFADTAFHYYSDVGDPIGQGKEQTVTPIDGNTIVPRSYFGRVGFDISNAASGDTYSMLFGPLYGGTLAPGQYVDVAGLPDQTHGQLNFVVDNRFNSNLTGHFEILEITYDTDGNLATFAADFVQHSAGATPASYGRIRYNSSIPYLIPSGIANLSSASYNAYQSVGVLTVTVDRRDGSSGPLSVDYSTTAGSALAGRDYTSVAGTLSWVDGDTASKTFNVPILNFGDTAQPDDTFLVRLNESVNDQAQATVTIADSNAVTCVHFDYDDSTSLSVERLFNRSTGFSVQFSMNGNGGVSLNFSNFGNVDAQFAESWMMEFAPAAGSSFTVGDYQGAVPFSRRDAVHPVFNLTGPAINLGAGTGDFQVLEVQFAADGSLEKFAANFTLFSSSRNSQQRGEVRYKSTVPIVPDHGATIFTDGLFSVLRQSGSATIIVNRVGGSAGALRVGYNTVQCDSAGAGFDYTAVSGLLDWADGDAAPKTFQVPILKGAGRPYPLQLYLKLSGLSLGSPNQATLTIQPEGESLAQFKKIQSVANVADDHVSLTVERVGSLSYPLQASFQTVDGTAISFRDFIETRSEVNWSIGDASPKTIAIPLVKGQPLDGGLRTFHVLLTGAVGTLNQEAVTISRTLVPTVSVEAPTAQTYESGGAPAVFTFTRNGDTSAPVTVNFELSGSAMNGSDYRLLGTKKIIKAGRSSAYLKVRPVDLGITGGKRTVKLSLMSDSAYSIAGDGAAKVKIFRDR